MTEKGNPYGLEDGASSHLMKNTEWGAVTYFAQSEYGKNSEIFVNTNTNMITGESSQTLNSNATYGYGYANINGVIEETGENQGSSTTRKHNRNLRHGRLCMGICSFICSK